MMQSLKSGGKWQGNFFVELEKNMAQHKVNERTYRYKLEVYRKTFQDFVCGNPKSTKTSG
jgi:hypothetical protein